MPASHATDQAQPHRPTARVLARLLLGLALITVAGCFGPNHRQLADEAFEANRYEVAVRHYQKALADRPRLLDDPTFAAQYNLAKVRAHTDRAQRRMNEGDYLNAVDELDKALVIDPTHPGAIRLRRLAAVGAADLLYKQALNQADLGDRQQAVTAIDRALSYQPGHLLALRARDALAGKGSAMPGAQHAYEQGRQHVEHKSWAQAVAQFDHAVKTDPSLLTARLARHEARKPIREADELFASASDLKKQKRLDAAITAIERAKAIRPHHTGYDAQHRALLADRNETERLLTQAVAAMSRSQWDQGLVMVKRARAVFPYHPRLDGVESDLRTRAAMQYTAGGDAHRQAGRLDQADDDYRKALAYAPKHGPASRGLADTATTRAVAAERQNRPGQALLWHTQAHRQINTPASAEAIARLRQTLEDRHAFGVQFSNAPAGANDTAWELQARVVRQLHNTAPSSVHIAPQPGRALGRVYTATVDAGISQQSVERINRTHGTHAYQVEQAVPNPRIGRIGHDIDCADRVLDKLVDKREDLLRRIRRAEQWKRQDPDNPAKQANIDRLQRELRANRRDIIEAERDLRRVEHALLREPRTVLALVDAYWPYKIDTYRQRVELTGRVTLRDAQTNRKLEAVSIRKGYSEEDKTLVGANPAIGLGEDPLEFTDHATIRSDLLDRAAGETAERLLRRAVEGEVAALRAQAKAQSAAGDHAGALESRVAAAVLLHHADARAAATYLDGLRRIEAGG